MQPFNLLQQTLCKILVVKKWVDKWIAEKSKHVKKRKISGVGTKAPQIKQIWNQYYAC